MIPKFSRLGLALLLTVSLPRSGAADSSRLTNLSARGVVTGDTDPLVAGFVVAGSAGKPLLLRAVGPTL